MIDMTLMGLFLFISLRRHARYARAIHADYLSASWLPRVRLMTLRATGFANAAASGAISLRYADTLRYCHILLRQRPAVAAEAAVADCIMSMPSGFSARSTLLLTRGDAYAGDGKISGVDDVIFHAPICIQKLSYFLYFAAELLILSWRADILFSPRRRASLFCCSPSGRFSCAARHADFSLPSIDCRCFGYRRLATHLRHHTLPAVCATYSRILDEFLSRQEH